MMAKKPELLSKDEALKLAARRIGFSVPADSYRHAQRRAQMLRYFKQGLVTRSFSGKMVTFYLTDAMKGKSE